MSSIRFPVHHFSPIRHSLSAPSTSIQSFTTTTPLLKKGGKAARAVAKSSEDEAVVEDPSDFSSLETSIVTVHERLKNELSKLRTGGRFNPEVLENLRVVVGKTAKDTIRLSELAQVVPKGGRSVVIMVGEADVC